MGTPAAVFVVPDTLVGETEVELWRQIPTRPVASAERARWAQWREVSQTAVGFVWHLHDDPSVFAAATAADGVMELICMSAYSTPAALRSTALESDSVVAAPAVPCNMGTDGQTGASHCKMAGQRLPLCARRLVTDLRGAGPGRCGGPGGLGDRRAPSWRQPYTTVAKLSNVAGAASKLDSGRRVYDPRG